MGKNDFLWDSKEILSLSNLGKAKLIFSKDLQIPSGTTKIREFAFANNQLTSVIIPDSVTEIEKFAFVNNQLTSVIIPRNVQRIGVNAFYKNKNNYVIAYSYKNIETWYYEKTGLKFQAYKAIGTDKVEWLKEDFVWQAYTVEGLSKNGIEKLKLTNKLAIPNEATKIGESAFCNFDFVSITIPDSVTSIGDYAFQNNQLTSVTIPNSVTSIGDYAFKNNQLTSITIPNSITSIEYSVFENNQLTSVTIPNSVTSIGASAFQNNQLTSVTIPNSVTSIEYSVFQNNQLTSVTIPNSVTSIGGRAFQNNHLTSVIIPDSVTSIGAFAFKDNPGITIAKDIVVLKILDSDGNYINPNNLQSEENYIINPQFISVQVNYINEEGEVLADSSKYIFTSKKTKTFNGFPYIEGYIRPNEITIEFTPEQDEYTVDVVYKKLSGDRILEIAKNSKNINFIQTKPDDTIFNIGDTMVSRVSFDLSGFDASLKDYKIKLFYNKDFFNKDKIKVISSNLIKNYDVKNDFVEITLGDVQGGTYLGIPIEWAFEKYVTPSNTNFPINAAIYDPSNNLYATANEINFSGWYYNFAARKFTNGNYYGGYVVTNNIKNGFLTDAEIIDYSFSANGVMRNIGEFKVTDILPEYKNKDGIVVKATFIQTENPEWTLSKDGKTVEYIGNADNSTNIKIPHLKLHAPGLQSFLNIKNSVKMELIPFMKGKNESVMIDTASISNYFKLPDKPEPEIPTPSPDYPPGEHPMPGWTGVDFKKIAATVHSENGHNFFYDVKKERNFEFSWYLSFKWNERNLDDITITDKDLDDRMYYSGFSPNSDFIGGTLEAYDNSNNLILVNKINDGSKIVFPDDIAKNISYVKINKKGFSEEKNYGALLIHTKLRKPNKSQFDDTPGSTRNIFKNNAEMTFTLKDGQKSTLKSSDNIGIRWLNQDIKVFKDTTFTGEHIYVENKGSYTIGIQKESERISDEMENFELVDLLPNGLELKSIETLEPFSSDKSISYEIVQNYKDSGRTAIVFKADELAYYENSYNRMNIARINVEIDDTIMEGTFTNDALLSVSNSNFKLINKVKFGDKDYSKASVSNYVLKAEELTSRTYVKKVGDVFWSKEGIKIGSNEEFEYRLSVFNNTPVNRTNMSIISVLPHIGDTALTQGDNGNYTDRGSEIVNKFDYKKGVTVPDGYTVYYLNELWKGMTDTIDNMDKTLNWETTPTENTSAIKIVANPGVTLKGQSEFHAVVPMIAPDNKNLSLSGKKAWASFVRKDDQSFRYIEPNKVYNEMERPTGTITLTKVGYDKTYQNLLKLKGVLFELRDVNNNILKAAVSNGDGIVSFTGLDLKKDYLVIETHTLNGYAKIEKPIEIKSVDLLEAPKYVYNIGNVVNNRLSEKLQPILGTVRLNKTDFKNNPLSGVKFNLKGGNKFDGFVNITVASDEQGDVYFNDIPYGKYTLTEIKHGALKAIEPQEISITKPHQVIDLGKISNDKIELDIFKVGVDKQPDVDICEFNGTKERKLEGAKFSLYKGNNLIKDSLVSDNKGLIKIENIDFNTVYTLKEIEAPEGYLKIYNEIKFKVTSNGQVLNESDIPFFSSDIYVPNLIKASIDIVKLGVLEGDDNKKLINFLGKEGEKLQGAEFELYQGNTLIMSDLITNENGLIELKSLEYDTKYILKEVAPPKNYLVKHKEIMLEFKKDGTRLISNEGILNGKTLYIPNTLEGTPSIINIKKTDKVTGLPLKDATFTLYKIENNKNIFVKEVVSDSNGRAYFKGVGKGTYKVIETKAPKGYFVDTKEEIIIVDQYEPKTFELTYEDTPLNLDINKVSYVAKAITKEEADLLKESDASYVVVQNKTLYDVYKPVGGAQFNIIDLSTKEIIEEATSTSNGKVPLTPNLYDISKVYRIIEISAPSEYEINRSGWDINFRDLQKQKDFDGNIRIALNNRLLKGQIIVSKYDKSEKTTISGVEFTLYNDKKQKIRTMVTDSYGIAKFSNLTVGTYYIEETKPAANYQPQKGKVKIEITKDDLVKTHILYNKRIIILPITGLNNIYIATLFISTLIALAYILRKKFVLNK